MPGLHPGDASSILADSTAPVVQEEGHRKTLRPAPRRAGRADLLCARARGRCSRESGAGWGELRVADAPGTVSRGRCREARFPNELFMPRRCGFESRLGHKVRGLRSTVGPQSSKLPTRVRLPPPAPSRFSDEDRGLQNRARGFDSLSALHGHAPLAQRKGHRLLSDSFQVHCASLRGSHCTPSTSWTPYSSNRLLGGVLLHVPVI